MKVQIEGQKIRFRLNRDELEKLCEERQLRRFTHLPGQDKFSVSLHLKTQEAALLLQFGGQNMCLHVQESAAQVLLQSLPNRDGLEAFQNIEHDDVLHLLLDIDIRAQKRKRVSREP